MIARMVKKGASPKAIYYRLRLDQSDALRGSLSMVKRRVARLKASAGVPTEDVEITVRTVPG